jgi:hypothetical protein
MQKAIVLTKGDLEAKLELDGLLHDGWRFISACPMPSSVGNIEVKSNPGDYVSTSINSYPPTCLVILEKDTRSGYATFHE